MSDKDNNGFFGLIEENWKKLLFLGGITAGIVGIIPKVQENPRLYVFVYVGVLSVIGIGACIYYGFIWKPEAQDGRSAIIIPGSSNPVKSQRKKEKQRKVIRRLASLGLLLIPLTIVSGFWLYRYQAQLPPTDFKILVADFESSDSSNYDVTQQIFSNLQTEMREYGDEVKVEKLGEPLESIESAKQAGKKQKAAIVIWGDYSVMKEIVPIRVNFEILHESSGHFKLGKSVQGKTQSAQISELETFQLQTSLSNEMTYLSLFTLGMYRYLDNDWQQAIQYLEKALNISQETNKPIASLGREVVYFYLGNSTGYLKRYDDSLEFLDRAVEINSDNDAAWYNRGNVLDQLGEYEQAIDSYNKAIAINSDNDAAWYNRGNALDQLGKYKQAVASHDKAIEIDSGYYAVWNNRGNALGKLGEHRQAIDSYNKAIAINPNIDVALYNRGNALDELGEYKQAIDSYNKAIAINADSDKVWYSLGNAFIKLGKYKRAIDSYNKAISTNADYDKAWNNRGVALEQLSRYQQAVSSYDQAIEINPDNDTTWYNLATIHAHQNDVDSTLKNLKQAFNLNSELRKRAETDTVFNAIREDKRFKKLIENKYND